MVVRYGGIYSSLFLSTGIFPLQCEFMFSTQQCLEISRVNTDDKSKCVKNAFCLSVPDSQTVYNKGQLESTNKRVYQILLGY